jgi:hypothetical protein
MVGRRLEIVVALEYAAMMLRMRIPFTEAPGRLEK